MAFFAIYDAASGEIVSAGSAPEAMIDIQSVEDGQRIVTADAPFDPASQIIVNDAVAARSTVPVVPLERRLAVVDRERDRRAELGFVFEGVRYQAREKDLTRMSGAATAAGLAVILAGARPGDLRWADRDADFGWIATDNSVTPMDAPTVIAFGKAAMALIDRLSKAARAIKDDIAAGGVPDVAADDRWPADD